MEHKISKHQAKQQGVALIQALILAALLALMAMQFTLSSRQQVASAQLFSDRVLAELELRSLKNELLFALFTITTNDTLSEQWASNAISQKWNFYGEPFSPRMNTHIQLQDTSGLVNIYLSGGGEPLRQFLNVSGVAPEVSTLVQHQLSEWQGGRFVLPGATGRSHVRGDFLRHEQELSFAAPALKHSEQIAPYLSRLLNVYHNPYFAPEAVLRSYLADEVVSEVIQRRKNNSLSQREFTELTRIFEDEETSFQFSRKLKVKLEVAVGKAVAREQAVWYIRPQRIVPLTPLQ